MAWWCNAFKGAIAEVTETRRHAMILSLVFFPHQPNRLRVSSRPPLEQFGHVVAVLDPWDASVPLTRVWCLWELLCAVEGRTKLQVVLSRAQVRAFEDVLVSDFDSIAASLSRVHARQSTAWLQSDRDTIFAAVEAGCGFTELNATVHSLLRDWLAAAGCGTLDKVPIRERGTIVTKVAHLLSDQGRLPEAEPLYLEAVAARRETLGDRHPDTLSAISNLGNLE